MSGVINMTKTGSLLLSVFIASSKYQAGRGASKCMADRCLLYI